MLHTSPEMPQHLILAIDHHQQLLDEARRYRQQVMAYALNGEHPMRWRRLRLRVGGFLIDLGERIRTEAKEASDPVWG